MKTSKLSNFQLTTIVILRIFTGWYFLYEGLAKLLSPGWSAYAYLMDSQGVFSGLFKSMAQSDWLMPVVDALNVYGLIIVGFLLIAGLFERTALLGGAGLILLYYLSHPASMNATYMLPPEGSYLWINKNMVMLAGMAVLFAFPTAGRIGLARYFFSKKIK